MQTPSEFFVRRHAPSEKTCFVLMPFEEGMTAVYEHGIKPLVESMNIQCRRADELYTTQGIMEDVWASIQSAEVVVADLTGKNPNVMYELGLCHALWKRVILLSQNKDDVPFDLRAWRVIWYDFTFAGSARLKEELQRAIAAVTAEVVTEGEIVPIKTHAVQENEQKDRSASGESEGGWQRGEVVGWNSEKDFGFIRLGDEDFYFNPSYLFDESVIPKVGDIVEFEARDRISEDAKNRRAARILVHGEQMTAAFKRLIPGKGFGFAEITGTRGDKHELFVLVRDDDLPLDEGERIEVTISGNRSGPIGMDVVSIS